MMPSDPIMLLSFVNMKLRDRYADPEEMCEDLEVSYEEIVEKLSQIDYHYDADRNQFI